MMEPDICIDIHRTMYSKNITIQKSESQQNGENKLSSSQILLPLIQLNPTQYEISDSVLESKIKRFEKLKTQFQQQSGESTNYIPLPIPKILIQKEIQLPEELKELEDNLNDIKENFRKKQKILIEEGIKEREAIMAHIKGNIINETKKLPSMEENNRQLGEIILQQNELIEQFQKDLEQLQFLYEEKKQENENLLKDVILLKGKLEEQIETNEQLYKNKISELKNYSSKQKPNNEIQTIKQQFDEQKNLFQELTAMYNEQIQQQQHFNLTIPEFQQQIQQDEQQIISQTDINFSKSIYKTKPLRLKPLSSRKRQLVQPLQFPFQL